VIFSNTLFYPLSFCDKKGEYFFIWTGIVFLTCQVFLSQNAQIGSLLVCNWLHSVGQNHFHVMMLFIKGSVIFRSLLFSEICF